ncbi:MAG: type IIA DNA topoisomerase subunit B [Alloprevotella sp.]|nr:type IIA DNA topoisomerase subunit B [Alloprevotella sp.]
MAEENVQLHQREEYTDDKIKHLDDTEHIRTRPGMYIGRLGDGSHAEDGIYVLLKETIDNSIDEFNEGFGKKIEVDITSEGAASVRDYGRGIPLRSLVPAVSQLNTGAKYDTAVFTASVGLNGVGLKAVNALSQRFVARSHRDGKFHEAQFERGKLVKDIEGDTSEENGTYIYFEPDPTLFTGFRFHEEFVENMLRNYTYLNTGLAIFHNGHRIISRNGLVAAIAIRVIEPLFESQTKIKLGSLTMAPEKDKNGRPFPLSGISVNKFVGDFVKEQVDNYLHKNLDVADVILQKIQESEKERKAIAGVTKLARERAKKANLHNRKLRDCRIHLNDPAPKPKKGQEEEADARLDSAIFITEGDSASGSITKSRNVNTQAVFSLRGKPLNSFGLTKKVVYENEEFNLLQAALNIEDGLDGLRYNKVIVATDADVDGMHIRLLMITFFLQFFPDLIKKGHVYILQTPLFRVRKKNQKREYVTRYCYSDEERLAAIEELGPDPEITRFKGLGEISPDEFRGFIGPDIRLEQVTLHKSDKPGDLMEYYMGKNTSERQLFIIDNLREEEDLVESEEA